MKNILKKITKLINLSCFKKKNNINYLTEQQNIENKYNEYLETLDKIENNQRNKIIIVTHDLNETGAPILAYNIAKKFQTKKYDVAIISLSDGYLENKYKDLEIPVFSLHQDHLNNKINNPEALDIIVKTLYEKGYKNAITNTIISGLTTPILKKYNFSIISLIHEMKTTISLYNLKAGGFDIATYSDIIVFPDKIVQQGFEELFNVKEKKLIICPQGLYKTKENIKENYEHIYIKYNIPKNSKIIMGSGTADYRKGIDLFLLAAHQLLLLEKDEQYHFIWTGPIINPELKAWFEWQLEINNKKDRFHNLDFIKDKQEYQNLVTCSDIFWLTSREDPFPSVMIEALEFNTPVIAFKNSGGANTLLQDGRGILIDNFDINKLVTTTQELLNNKKEIKIMLKKAQTYIKKNLNFNNYIEDLEKLIKEIK